MVFYDEYFGILMASSMVLKYHNKDIKIIDIYPTGDFS